MTDRGDLGLRRRDTGDEEGRGAERPGHEGGPQSVAGLRPALGARLRTRGSPDGKDVTPIGAQAHVEHEPPFVPRDAGTVEVERRQGRVAVLGEQEVCRVDRSAVSERGGHALHGDFEDRPSILLEVV